MERQNLVDVWMRLAVRSREVESFDKDRAARRKAPWKNASSRATREIEPRRGRRIRTESLFYSVVALLSSVPCFSDNETIDVEGSISLSFERAFARRDMTVPTGQSRRVAISS
jgi:hypothetical protein